LQIGSKAGFNQKFPYLTVWSLEANFAIAAFTLQKMKPQNILRLPYVIFNGNNLMLTVGAGKES
jgi:hypothetical protein